MPSQQQTDTDAAADRIMQMLDVALAAVQRADGEGALLALMEANDVAATLPKMAPA